MIELEARVKSLSSKVDSLVKFLEEERNLRKDAEQRAHENEKRLKELETEV